jgi:hypothetical protein
MIVAMTTKQHEKGNDKATKAPKQKAAKYPWSVKVTPNTRPDLENCAGVEATLQLTEGEAVLRFVPPDTMAKDLAETIRKALEERKLREVRFDPKSETQGQVFVMWEGKPFPVGFFLSVSGPDYLYPRVKKALREFVSKEL